MPKPSIPQQIAHLTTLIESVNREANSRSAELRALVDAQAVELSTLRALFGLSTEQVLKHEAFLVEMLDYDPSGEGNNPELPEPQDVFTPVVIGEVQNG